jgi:DNA-binding response OmpR family regulator
MLAHLLAQSEYEVMTAGSFNEALQLIRENEYDLYVLDRRFPDGTGVELCRQLSALTPGTPIIFYSGDAYELHKQEGIKAGANAYVTKPMLEQLIMTVNRLLGERACAGAGA